MTSTTSTFNTEDPSYISGQISLVQSYEQNLNHIKTVVGGVINNGTSYAVGTTKGSGEVNTNGVVLLGNAPGASKITVHDANNHHTTWGALGAAVFALNGALSTAIGHGTVVFGIYDGRIKPVKGRLLH
ncbi:hypothetical protein MMC08_008114 [Hypocenomyce scalaris]|nr:hypothetical protein [Hypocenomyce scalaris]